MPPLRRSPIEPPRPSSRRSIRFDGVHQAGILTDRPMQATFAALDSFAPDRATLIDALKALSHRASQLTVGGAVPVLEIDAPPTDSGILGPVNMPDNLTVTIAFGASLFDDRYGLATQRPRELTQMPVFPIDAARSRAEPRRRAVANLRQRA
jgi:deferrochelatase/peroxidase EfeB